MKTTIKTILYALFILFCGLKLSIAHSGDRILSKGTTSPIDVTDVTNLTEWTSAGAFYFDIDNGHPNTAGVYAVHREDGIHLRIHIHDGSINPADALRIYFDLSHDAGGALDNNDWGVEITRSLDNPAIWGPANDESTWNNIPVTLVGRNNSISPPSTDWIVELKIPLGQISPAHTHTLDYSKDSIGIYFQIFSVIEDFADPFSSTYNQWPNPTSDVLIDANPNLWGNYVFDDLTTYPDISLTGVRRAGDPSNYYKIKYSSDNTFEVELKNPGGTAIPNASDVRINLYLAAIGIGESWHRLDTESVLDNDCNNANWISYTMPNKTDFCSGSSSLPDISTQSISDVVENNADYTIKNGLLMTRIGGESITVPSGFDDWVSILNWNTTDDQDKYFTEVTVDGTTYNRRHSCMRAEAIYPNDPNTSNNYRQRNMNFSGTPGLTWSFFSFSLGWAGFNQYNPDEGKEMFLDVAWKNVNPKDGWKYKLDGAEQIGPNKYKARLSGSKSIPVRIGINAPRPEVFGKILKKQILVPANAGGRLSNVAIPSGAPPIYIDVKSGSTLLISSFSMKEKDEQSIVLGATRDVVPKGIANGPTGLSKTILNETLKRVDAKYRDLLVPDAPLGSLVGSFDEFKSGFAIAEGVQVKVPPGATKLALAINGLIGLYDRNEGPGFQVKIMDRSKAVGRLTNNQDSSYSEDKNQDNNINTEPISDILPALWINGYEDTGGKRTIGGTPHELFRYIGNVGWVITDIYPANRFELVLPFAGRFFFDNKLELEDANVIGAKLAYLFNYKFAAELEGGLTSAKTTSGTSGKLIQFLINGRYTFTSFPVGQNWMSTYVTAGAGYMLFRDFGTNDGAFAYQAGVGIKYEIKPWLGIRADTRYMGIGDVTKPGTTTMAGSTQNIQSTAGLVFWF